MVGWLLSYCRNVILASIFASFNFYHCRTLCYANLGHVHIWNPSMAIMLRCDYLEWRRNLFTQSTSEFFLPVFCSWLSYPHLPRAKGKHLHFAAQPRGADLRTGLPGQKWLSVAMSDWKKNGNPTISNRGSMFLQSIVCALNRIQDLHTQNSVCRCMCRICTCFSIACVVVSAHHFLHPLVHFQSFSISGTSTHKSNTYLCLHDLLVQVSIVVPWADILW